ncbi:alpha/beta fold hydrolase [Aquiluna sp. Uisw_065]|uniref:alpha/beta fold hydrolase n=1 Tax=Aquiluna sp. Uisw_065 TaxID=3230967 RepID=UPI0039EB1242
MSAPTPWVIEAPVAGYHWKAKNPRAQLLLQHGLGEYSKRYVTQYSQLIPKLVASGLDVYAIDLKGHGNTAGIRGLVDVVAAVDDHLVARAAMPKKLPTFLLGHSLGGLVTAGSIVRDQANIEAAIISSSAMQAPSSAGLRALTKVLARIAPEAPVPVPRPGIEAFTRDKELLEVIANDPEMFLGKARNLVGRTTLLLSDEVWSKASVWNVPTLFIHGDKDTSTEVENSVKLHAAISSKDKTLKVYPGGYHELLNDNSSQEVLSDLFAWLDKRSSVSK